MAEVKKKRLSQVLREFNISLDRAVEFLGSKGFEVEANPNTKVTGEEYEVLFEEFETDKSKKIESKEVGEEKRKEKEELSLEREREIEERQKKKEASRVIRSEVKLEGPKQVGKIDLSGTRNKPAVPAKEKVEEIKKPEETPVETEKKEVEEKLPIVEIPQAEIPEVEITKTETPIADIPQVEPPKPETVEPEAAKPKEEEKPEQNTPVKENIPVTEKETP